MLKRPQCHFNTGGASFFSKFKTVISLTLALKEKAMPHRKEAHMAYKSRRES